MRGEGLEVSGNRPQEGEGWKEDVDLRAGRVKRQGEESAPWP